MKKFREMLMNRYKMKVAEITDEIERNQHDWALVDLLSHNKEHYIEKIQRLKRKI